jgi:hypothetical protein
MGVGHQHPCAWAGEYSCSIPMEHHMGAGRPWVEMGGDSCTEEMETNRDWLVYLSNC